MNLTYAYGAKAPIKNADVVNEQISKAHRYYNRLVSLHRDYKVVRETLKGNKEAKEELKERLNALMRVYRAECDVYWGTYLTVEAACSQAASTKDGPNFHRWDWCGTVAVQFAGGLPVEQLFGDDQKVRIIGEGKRRELWLRVASEGGEPVWAVFPFVFHRCFPPGAVVKWVKCIRRKVGTHLKWSAQFIISVPFKEVTPQPGVVGIDVGWRVRPNGIRVAYWFDGCNHGELLIPQRIIDRWRKTEDLRSIRDKSFNESLQYLLDSRKDSWPEWLRDRIQYARKWKEQSRLAALILAWRHQRFDGDEQVFNTIESWRQQDKHLYDWEAHQRENVLRARRELYRLFVIELRRYGHIVIEELDLRQFAELPGEDEEPDRPITKAARTNRFKAGLSEFLTHLVQDAIRQGAVVSETPAAYTTMQCSWCGHIDNFDAAPKIEHTCTSCGQTWDQDHNAARNLFRAAQWCKEPGNRSKNKSIDPATGKTQAELRREKGLATRREAARKRREKMNENKDVA